MPTGVVKKWFNEKGFGFFGPDDGSADVFAHARQLSGGDSSTVRDGMKVTFETEWDDRKGKPKASSWMVMDGAGGGAMCGGANMGGGAPAGFPSNGFMNFGGMPAPNYGAAQLGGFGTMPNAGGFGGAPAQNYGAIPGGAGDSRYSPYGGTPAANFGMAPATGWEQTTDPSSGKTYYFNRSTGETSWTPPAGANAAATAPAAAVAADEQLASQLAPEPASQPAAALPEGWEQATDPASGKTYYFNRGTGATSWTPP